MATDLLLKLLLSVVMKLLKCTLYNSGFQIINLDASHSLKFVQVSSEQEMIESSVWYVKLFGQIHFFRPINISSTVFSIVLLVQFSLHKGHTWNCVPSVGGCWFWICIPILLWFIPE